MKDENGEEFDLSEQFQDYEESSKVKRIEYNFPKEKLWVYCLNGKTCFHSNLVCLSVY